MRIAKPAITALKQYDLLSRSGQIGQQGFIVLGKNLRSGRHLQYDVFARFAGAVSAHTVRAPPGIEMLAITIINQRIEIFDTAHHNIAAAPAIAAVGTAKLDIFFAPERQAAIAPCARFYIYARLVKKLHMSRYQYFMVNCFFKQGGHVPSVHLFSIICNT